MSKKKGIFDIQIEQPLFHVRKQQEQRNDLQIEQSLTVILKQLVVGGCERTLYDYRTIVHYRMENEKIMEQLIEMNKTVLDMKQEFRETKRELLSDQRFLLYKIDRLEKEVCLRGKNTAENVSHRQEIRYLEHKGAELDETIFHLNNKK